MINYCILTTIDIGIGIDYKHVCMEEAYASTEAEFLDVIGTKVFTIFLLAIHSHPSTNGK